MPSTSFGPACPGCNSWFRLGPAHDRGFERVLGRCLKYGPQIVGVASGIGGPDLCHSTVRAVQAKSPSAHPRRPIRPTRVGGSHRVNPHQGTPAWPRRADRCQPKWTAAFVPPGLQPARPELGRPPAPQPGLPNPWLSKDGVWSRWSAWVSDISPGVPSGGTLAKCDLFGFLSTSHWTGVAIIVQFPRTKTCIVTRSRTSSRPTPCSLAG